MISPAPTIEAPMATPKSSGLGDFAPWPAIVHPTPVHAPLTGGHLSSTRNTVTTPNEPARVEEYNRLDLPAFSLAENVNDIETTRISMGHRLRQLAEAGASPQELATLEALSDQLTAVEAVAVKALQKAMRAHPLGPWVKQSKGVGEKQAARLLAAIGNPYWNQPHNRPRRGPAELWAYCGYHVLPAGPGSSDTHVPCAGGQPSATPTDPRPTAARSTSVGGVAPKRRKGQKSNWNSNARTRAYLVATSCIKSDGGYREVYDTGRAKYVELPKGHAHNRALRLVAKAVLKDIFLEAKAWHEAGA